MAGNYWSALGLNIAENTGAREASVASQALSGASSSIEKALTGQEKAYEASVNASNSFGNLLGNDKSGWTSIAKMMSDEEKKANEEAINQFAENQFLQKQQEKYNEIGKLLELENKKETENMYLNTTGYTKEFITNEIDNKITTLAKTARQDKASSIALTNDYIKELVLNPYSLTLQTNLTDAQKQLIKDIRNDTKLYKAIEIERALQQTERDRNNGVYSEDELKLKAAKLKEGNHTIFNDKTTEDIYHILLNENNARAGRKADETLDEYLKRKKEAEQNLSKLIIGLSDKPEGYTQTPNQSESSNPNSSSTKTTSVKISNKVSERIKRENKNLLNLDTSDLSPSALMSQVDNNVKGEINPELGIGEIAEQEEGFFKNENDTIGLTPLPTSGDIELTAKTHITNLAKLTPKGQKLYREGIKAKQNLDTKYNNVEFKGGRFGGELKNYIQKVKDNKLTFADMSKIKNLKVPFGLANKDTEFLSNVLNDLKKVVEVEDTLSFKSVSTDRHRALDKVDRDNKGLETQIKQNLVKFEELKKEIKSDNFTNKEKAKKEVQQEELTLKNKELIKELQANTYKGIAILIDGTGSPVFVPSTDKEFAASKYGTVIGIAIGQDKLVSNFDGKQYPITGLDTLTEKNGVINPGVAFTYIAVARALTDNKARTVVLNKILENKKINTAFKEYTKNIVNKNRANKTLSNESLTRQTLTGVSLDDLNKVIGDELNKILDEHSAELVPASGYSDTIKTLVNEIIPSINNMSNYANENPLKNIKDFDTMLRNTK